MAMEKYRTIKKIGEGCFGSVHAAINQETGEYVAIKRIPITRIDEGIPHNVAREILISERMSHKNIATVREVFAHGSSIALVTEYCDGDLSTLLHGFDWGNRMPRGIAKNVLCELLRGLRFLHREGVAHRDVKPSNCLISRMGHVLLSDFGLARILTKETLMTHEVSTRWYRAPELLFGCRTYDEKVDMWSCGCIMAELLSGCGDSVLFCGDGDIDQISRIFRLVGSPTVETWPGHTNLPDWGKIIFEEVSSSSLHELFPDCDHLALDLLGKLLKLNPEHRISADDALRHPWFRETPLPDTASVLKFLKQPQ